jgi:hypothetical protein
MEWISVKERLPQIGQCVLVWKVWHGHKLAVYDDDAATHRRLIRRDRQWWNDGEQITHWMPLPDPPKK